MISAFDTDLAAVDETGKTPQRVFLPSVARERFAQTARLCATLSGGSVRLAAGYSVKTNPRAELLRTAMEHGFFAETISRDERAWAASNGFKGASMIANGPEPVGEGERAVAFVFADSVEAFQRNARRRVAALGGVRLRPSMTPSRFGVPAADEERLRCALLDAPQTGLGVSFHARREDFHGASWRDVASDVLERATILARTCGRDVEAFDVGGGWTPAEFDRDFAEDMAWLLERVTVALPACRTVLFEPGQALCTPVEALLTRVLEVRTRPGAREAIVDAGYADWPQMHAHPHHLSIRRRGRWERLGVGGDRIGGRTCLEYDLVEGVRLPADIAAGDFLAVGDVGAYDHSMAYSFARGEESFASNGV